MSDTATISIRSESGGYFVQVCFPRECMRCPTYSTTTLEEAEMLREDIIVGLNYLNSLRNGKK
jgi:predicted RNase H-like HicB family nuclease